MLQQLLDKYILKKRYIYSLMNTNKVDIKLNETQCIILKGNRLIEHQGLFNELSIKKTLIARSENPNVFCLVCFDKNNSLVGYFWGIVPQEKIWHDSIPLEKGQGFLFNGYVNPQFRGNNVFPFLIHEIAHYIKQNYSVNEIIDVVERQNIASIRAHSKINAKIDSINFLFKIIGRNVFSLYRKKMFLLSRSKRNRI